VPRRFSTIPASLAEYKRKAAALHEEKTKLRHQLSTER
jgi:hypothetical protein